MSDLISRSRLIEEIKRYQMDIVSKATAMKVIRNAPTVTDTNVGGKWIPCSERLPKIEEEPSEYAKDVGRTFLVAYKDGFVCECVFWRNENKFDEDVIAWMPLPEPYKGE